jgi:glutamine synthetase
MHFIVEYIWLDSQNKTRSKTRVLRPNSKLPFGITDVPDWNYDGSSTGQAGSDGDTEIILKPCMLYKNPFHRTGQHWLVLCDVQNIRKKAVEIFDQLPEEEPWFGLEQEYFILHSENGDISRLNSFQGPYYCGVGFGYSSGLGRADTRKFFERIIAEEHLDACLYAGLHMSGLNAEVACHQWEFQVGPCEGISAADQLHVARYILERIAEKYECIINYEPKLLVTINGSGCHVNFSTRSSRGEGGLDLMVEKYIPNLGLNHSEDIQIMGKNNERRLTGKHETSSFESFNFGIGTRNTSVRIGNETHRDGFGYFEDRRPAANMEPYLVTSTIFKRCCL